MSLRDIELQNTLTRINKLEAILSLSILKHENPENMEEIDELLSDTKNVLYADNQGSSNLNCDEQLKTIKKQLENKQVQEEVSIFDFDIKTLGLESILDELNQFNFKLGDYIQTIGSSNLVYLNKLWIEGSTILWNSLKSLERAVKKPLQLILAEAESYIKRFFQKINRKK